MNNKIGNLVLLCVNCRQTIILGEVSTNHAETLEKVSNIIVKYSEWLESKGIDVKEVINDDKKKQVL